MSERLDIQIAYADQGHPVVRRFTLAKGATVADALETLRRDFAAHAGARQAAERIDDLRDVGIFGKIVRRETVLMDGDRVELYEPLLNDPKAARRQRARSSARRR